MLLIVLHQTVSDDYGNPTLSLPIWFRIGERVNGYLGASRSEEATKYSRLRSSRQPKLGFHDTPLGHFHSRKNHLNHGLHRTDREVSKSRLVGPQTDRELSVLIEHAVQHGQRLHCSTTSLRSLSDHCRLTERSYPPTLALGRLPDGNNVRTLSVQGQHASLGVFLVLIAQSD
jgi:hypothetical protein